MEKHIHLDSSWTGGRVSVAVSEITHSFTTPYSLHSEFNIVDYIVDSTAERLGHYSARCSAPLITSQLSHK